MIRPQLTNDGRAVRLLSVAEFTAPLLDDLARAYADNPEHIGRLLTAHAAKVAAADHAQWSDTATDYGRAIAAAEADGTRDALAEELPAEHQLDPQLPPDDAITTATRITRLAAYIRHMSTKEPRK